MGSSTHQKPRSFLSYVPKWMWFILAPVALVYAGIWTLIIMKGIDERIHNPMREEDYGYEAVSVTVGSSTVTALSPLTERLQAKGLAGRTSLDDSEGMLFSFQQPDRHTFWMHGMLIPLDFIWINDGRVVELTPKVSAPEDPNSVLLPRLRPAEPVTDVLEVRSGWTADHAISVGDQVTVTPPQG